MKTFKEMWESDEKKAFFLERTNKHIERVKRNADFIENSFLELVGLRQQTKVHDASKFEEPEVGPYIEITWNYKIGAQADNDLSDALTQASEHHVNSNKHHPEYWDNDDSPTINPDDRDKPLRLIDGTSMDVISLAEMVCDWQSMSQEYNEKSCRKWADDNINVRWQFTDDQVELIYKIIETFEIT